MSIGCKIIRDFPRPDPELVELFRDLPVANIDDCMERTAAVDSAIVPLGKGQLLGSAFTVRVAHGDNLMLHAAMDLAKPGDVILIDAGGFTERAIFGELMATYCKIRGVRGIVCDGAVRDAEALADKMNDILNSDLQAMGRASLQKIQPYTIENMAKVHEEIFENGR